MGHIYLQFHFLPSEYIDVTKKVNHSKAQKIIFILYVNILFIAKKYDASAGTMSCLVTK